MYKNWSYLDYFPRLHGCWQQSSRMHFFDTLMSSSGTDCVKSHHPKKIRNERVLIRFSMCNYDEREHSHARFLGSLSSPNSFHTAWAQSGVSYWTNTFIFMSACSGTLNLCYLIGGKFIISLQTRDSMNKRTRWRFDPDFRLKAAQLVVDQNYSAGEAAKAMNASYSSMAGNRYRNK